MAKPAFARIRIEGPYWAANSGFLGFYFKDAEYVTSDTILTPDAYLSGPRTPVVFGFYEGIFGDVASADIDEVYVFVVPADKVPDNPAFIGFDWLSPYDGFDMTIELSLDGVSFFPAGVGRVESSGPTDIPLSWSPGPVESFWTGYVNTSEANV